MNKILRRSSVLVSAVLAASMVNAFGQATLRRAMDFDGDGKADVAVMRSSENTFYVNRSNGNVFSATQFGILHTDTPAPGDYDGDGKADIAVWRYTNGVFYSLDSSTGALRTRQFGTVGDELIQRLRWRRQNRLCSDPANRRRDDLVHTQQLDRCFLRRPVRTLDRLGDARRL